MLSAAWNTHRITGPRDRSTASMRESEAACLRSESGCLSHDPPPPNPEGEAATLIVLPRLGFPSSTVGRSWPEGTGTEPCPAGLAGHARIGGWYVFCALLNALAYGWTSYRVGDQACRTPPGSTVRTERKPLA
jgi:hypothetical protein